MCHEILEGCLTGDLVPDPVGGWGQFQWGPHCPAFWDGKMTWEADLCLEGKNCPASKQGTGPGRGFEVRFGAGCSKDDHS